MARRTAGERRLQDHPRRPELRALHPGMALFTRDGAMLPFERVSGPRVIRNWEGGAPEGALVVTGGAVRRTAGHTGRAGVRIGVTVATAAGRRPGSLIGPAVTLAARHGGVPAPKRVPGAIVIERARAPVAEAAGDMAVAAADAKTTGMRILVTRRTLREGELRQRQIHPVA